MELRKKFQDYKSEFIFGALLVVGIYASLLSASYLSAEQYELISEILNGCIATICLAGAWLMNRHSEGLRVRKIWVSVLIAFALFATLLLMRVTCFVDQPKQGLVSLQGWEMVVGNFLAWLLLTYLAEVLRPGWLNWKRAFRQGLPVCIAFALDELLDIDLRILLALYPLVLLVFLVSHIVKYRQWCEENYSSMDNIDVQWIVRYVIMYVFFNGFFFALCFFATIPVAFTQQWVLLLMLIYSTEQILFRPDPWKMRRHKSVNSSDGIEENEEDPAEEPSIQFDPEYREILDKWIETEKPYTNPEFRLLDLRQVLPLNRTYLSTFINVTYGCNFYQFVTNYRIKEAKHLMKEHPDMQFQDVSERSGFSSPTVFSRVFSREVGMTPKAWSNQEKQ
jgi:AraC-like DNA-binding protein